MENNLEKYSRCNKKKIADIFDRYFLAPTPPTAVFPPALFPGPIIRIFVNTLCIKQQNVWDAEQSRERMMLTIWRMETGVGDTRTFRQVCRLFGRGKRKNNRLSESAELENIRVICTMVYATDIQITRANLCFPTTEHHPLSRRKCTESGQRIELIYGSIRNGNVSFRSMANDNCRWQRKIGVIYHLDFYEIRILNWVLELIFSRGGGEEIGIAL